MVAVELIELQKHYRSRASTVRAVDGITLRVEAGEFVAVVGRSGSGKTTLLDLVGLLLRPTSGRLLIDGADAGALGDGRRSGLRARRIGFVFQEYNLLPALTVLDNVLLPLRYSGGRRSTGRTRAIELIDRVGLGDRLRARPDDLSGGQRQRVAIARAMVNRPALLLADEPTGAVDSQTARELVDLVSEMNQDEGVTVLVVTHDMEVARRARRIVQLRDGRVLADEPVAALAG